ncbi:MAG TPA: DUF58 domain-containing protein [Bryobacteraceae bacterium]|jgi:uncharacterized protein (DUF58 family)|nr:DUF58 domain-containing protein [Bryobacteraceae bacterium]
MTVPSARLLWIAALAALPAAAIAGLYPALLIPCALFLAVVVLLAVADATAGRERLAGISLRTPEFIRVTKGVPAKLPLTVENRTKATVMARLSATAASAVTLEYPAEELPLAPGASALDWQCTVSERGDHASGALYLEGRSPLGLWQVRGRRENACVIRSYPNMRDRASAELFYRTAQVGQQRRRQIGKGREFEHLRQYMPGDSFEDVNWKATARRGIPVVKQYQVEHAQEVYAIVDSSRLSMREGAPGSTILESYVDAALHLALVAQKSGDRFGLITFSGRTHHFLRARNGMGHFRAVRETIYNLRGERVNPDFRDVFTTLQINLRRRSLLVFFTSLDDALLAEMFERDAPLIARRHVVLVNCARTGDLRPLFETEPAALDDLYAGLAGQMLWNRMRKLTIALQNIGVRLALVDAANIKSQVTAQYAEIKRRQIL